MITAKNLTKKFANDVILDNVEFILGNNKKIGLVGKNGCGKSTLLKMIVGEEDISNGVLKIESERIAYIPQEFTFEDMLVGEFLEKNLEYSWELYRIDDLAQRVQFKNFDLYQEIKTLSEGQKMKLKIIQLLLQSPTILLIDEPTNHLDINGILWFEKFINNLNLTVLMISHDREFLNHTVDEIWEIDKHKLTKFVGSYDEYKEEKLRLINKLNEEYIRFVKKKNQLEAMLDRTKRRLAGAKTGRAIRAVKKRIEREVTNNQKERYVNEKVESIDLYTTVHSKKLMVRLSQVSKYFGNKRIFENINLELRGKEKLWLFGPNGGGKSTLLKIITDKIKPTDGIVTIGENVNIGYFSQVAKNLDSKEKIIDYFVEKTQTEYFKSYSVLEKFLFTKDDLKKRVWQLSPGERSRFNLAIFTTKKYDFLIMDEPDNHLDIETKEALEHSLKEYNGALLLVSHDRYFVESVGITKILNLEDGILSLC